MFDFALINLILYEFFELHLTCVVLFHCWPQETLQQFSINSTHYQLYTQYIDLNNSEALDDLGYRYLRYRRPKIAIYLDMNCQGTANVIEQTSHLRYFNQHQHWLIYDHHSNMTRFRERFNNVNLSIDADISFVIPREKTIPSILHNKSFLFYDAYNNGWHIGGQLNVTPNYELQCNRLGCHRSKYLSELYKRSVYGNRETLRDITLRVGVVITKINVNESTEKITEYLMAERDYHIDPLSRLGYRIHLLLMDSLHFKAHYEFHDRWTDVEYTGGAVGALVTEAADLLSTPFFMTTRRMAFVTPIAATGAFRSVCMFRTPRNSGMQGNVFLEPFSTSVWIIFTIMLFLSAAMLWLAFFVEFHKMGRYIINYAPSLLTTCLISFGSACVQDVFLVPTSMGGRSALISLLLVTFIMYNYYTSLVVSSLLGSPVKSKIRTLRDLADSDLEVGLEPLPYTFTYLNFSGQPDVQHFVKKKIQSKKNSKHLWLSANEGIAKMRHNPGYVFVFETSTGYNIIENTYESREICDLNEILFRSDSLLFLHLHRNSSYREILRLKIVRLLETGVHSKYKREWVRTHLNCLDNNLVINVGMEYAAPLFLMLVFGYALALFFLMLEKIWRQWEMKKK